MKSKLSKGFYCLLMSTIAAVAVCFVLSGCLKSKMVVKVKKDGSGDIIVTNIFSKEVVAMIENQMKEMKNAGAEGAKIDMKDPFYNEEQIKREARKYGPDVQFVKAVKYDKDGCKGFVAQYSFPDISKVTIPMKNKPFEPDIEPGMVGDEENDEIAMGNKNKEGFKFKFEKGDTAKLKIAGPAVPEKKLNAAKADEPAAAVEQTAEDKAEIQQMMANGNPLGLTGNETQEQVMKKLFGGMKMTIQVEVDGTDVKSNATYKSGDNNSRCTLFDMDMDRLMEIPSFMKMMKDGPGGGGNGILDIYAVTPEDKGISIEKNKETVVEFK